MRCALEDARAERITGSLRIAFVCYFCHVEGARSDAFCHFHVLVAQILITRPKPAVLFGPFSHWCPFKDVLGSMDGRPTEHKPAKDRLSIFLGLRMPSERVLT